MRCCSTARGRRWRSPTGRYVSRLLDLAFLAPGAVEAILEGRQPVELTAGRPTQEIEAPMVWEEQVEALRL